MKNNQGTGDTKVLLRSQTGFSWLYRLFNIVFVILMVATLAIAVFSNINTFHNFKWYFLLLAMVLAAGLLLAFNEVVHAIKVKGRWAEPTAIILLFLVFIALQAYLGWQLRLQMPATPAEGRWDFDIVYSYAQQYVVNGTLPDEYFLNFSNNIGLYTFFCGFFAALHQMGMSDFTIPCLVLNIVSIDVALLLLWKAARLLMSKRKALVILVCAMCTSAFLLYVPVFYTDTLTLVFPIGAVYLWLKARRAWRQGNSGGTMGRFLGLSVLLAVGALLKVTVAIVWIAIALDLLIILQGKGRAGVFFAGLGTFLVLLLGGSWLLRHTGLLPAYNWEEGIPFTHWVMMGLHRGNGGYVNTDYELTLAQPDKAARYTFTLNEIQARLSDMGFFRTVQHLGDKLSYTFGDGTYYSALKLDTGAANPNFLHDIVVPGGQYFTYFAYATFGVHAAMLLGMVVAAIKSILRRNDALTFVRVAVFGLVLFLLLWETRSRYLINFLPLMLLVSMEAFPMPKRPRPHPARKTVPADAAPLEADLPPAQPLEEGLTAEELLSPTQPEGAVETTVFAPADAPAEWAPTEEPSLFAEAPLASPLEAQPAANGENEPEAGQADSLFDAPKVVEKTHTQVFDVPTGDPFFELAHTASWKVSEVVEPAGAAAGAQPEAAITQEELLAELDEATPAMPKEPAPAPHEEPAPPAQEAAPNPINTNDAFVKAAVSALEGEGKPAPEADLFAGDAPTAQPAPLPPAGQTPDDLGTGTAAEPFQPFGADAAGGNLFAEAPLATPQDPDAPAPTAEPAPENGGDGKPASLWDFDDGQ